MDRPISRLGTTHAVVRAPVEEKVGWFRRRSVERELGYLEWVIDGVPLRELVAWPDGEATDEAAPVQNACASRAYEADYLRAILGKPVTDGLTVMPDGRVPLMVCHFDFDLSCQALTATLVRDGDTVAWRDIAWQVDYVPLDIGAQATPAVTLVFAGEQYDDVVAPLLASALSV